VSSRLPSPRAAKLWPIVVVLAVLALLPVGRASEAALGIAAIAAIVLAVRGRIDWRDPAIRLVALLFACYWIPSLVSLLSAVEPSRTGTTIATTLRFLPFAAFVVWALRDARSWPATTLAIAVVTALWLIDAYVQIVTGYSLGGPAEAERLSGIFGAGNLKLGPTLAVLSPFVLITAHARFGWRGLGVAFVALAVPILLAGSRAAWLMYALVCVVVAWRATRSSAKFALVVLASIAIVGAAGALSMKESTGFVARVERSLLVLRGTESSVDTASAGRISIWRTAIAMFEAHPATGVGVRGFRYAYPKYAAPNDTFVDTASDTGASHAHQIVLEVLSETGVVGLFFWIAGAFTAIRAWFRAQPGQRERASAPALALVAMCFPLNTHFAFYSAWWGLFFWWLVALYAAALGSRENADA
jgi:O-antigen ligase